MATRIKVLGQVNPTANTLTTVYTVPASNSAVVSTIAVCNTGTANALFSLAVRVANAAIATSQYIAFNTTVPSYDTVVLTLGLSLAATDVLSANVSTANIAVSAFGTEVF